MRFQPEVGRAYKHESNANIAVPYRSYLEMTSLAGGTNGKHDVSPSDILLLTFPD